MESATNYRIFSESGEGTYSLAGILSHTNIRVERERARGGGPEADEVLVR